MDRDLDKSERHKKASERQAELERRQMEVTTEVDRAKLGGKTPGISEEWKGVREFEKDNVRTIKKPKRRTKKKEVVMREDQQAGQRLKEWFTRKGEIPILEKKLEKERFPLEPC